MARNSVLIYRDFFETMKGVSERSYKRIMNAVMAYALDGVEPNLSGLESVVFAQAKIWIDNNNRRYENGKQGGRPRNQTETPANDNQEKTEQEPNQNQTITEIKPNGNQTETKEEPTHNLSVKCKVLSDKCNLKERKKVIYIKNNTQGARETYDEIMDDWGCSPPVKSALGRFIQHCALNKQKLTNDRLDGIIRELDLIQGLDEDEQVKALDTAIAKGYYDIKRSG